MGRIFAATTRAARAAVIACLFGSGALAQEQGAAARAPERVVFVRIHGELRETMVATLERAMERAADGGAAALVVDIDTPGGAVDVMDRIGRKLGEPGVPTVAYVSHEAASAGAYVALACERIYTAEHAQIGSAYPIIMIPGGGLLPEDALPKNVMEKQLSFLRAKFRDVAQSHRPGASALAQAMVDPDVEVVLVATRDGDVAMTADEHRDVVAREGAAAARVVRTIVPKGKLLALSAAEAFDLGFTDGIVRGREELLEAIGLAGAEVVDVRPSWSEAFVGLVSAWRYLLLGAGFLLLFLELKTPGVGLPGALGATLLTLVFARNWMVGLAEAPEILLVVLGIVLLAIELFVLPGFGVAGIAGLVALALGVLLSFLPFFFPQGPLETQYLGDVLVALSQTVAVTLVALYLVSRFVLPRLPFYRKLALQGAAVPGAPGVAAGEAAGELLPVQKGTAGVAATPLRPSGKVEAAGELHDAVSDGGWIDRGEPVVVVDRTATYLVVRAGAAGGGEP